MPRPQGRTTPLGSAGATPGTPATFPSDGRRTIRDSFPIGAGAERRTIAAVLGLLLTVWLVAVFGRALADSNALNDRQAREEAINAGLRAQVAAGRAEIAYFQTDQFLQFEARGYGMGSSHERAFALQPGAPDPAPIKPLGAAEEPATPQTPLDDWLKLIFGG